MGYLVLDMIRQTVIKVVLKGTFSIAPDLHHNLVELNHILGDTLTILHGQVVELVLHISDRVVHEEEVWFKPLQGDTFEVGLCEGDFDAVLGECPRVILEAQLALHEEDLEFAGISPVKLVQFLDFGVLRGLRGVVT